MLPFSVNGSIVPIKLDTGAQVCTMGENSYHSLSRKPKLHSRKVQLRAYGSNKIEVLWKCELNVQYKNRAVKLLFHILKGNSQALLNREACTRLSLIKLLAPVQVRDTNGVKGIKIGSIDGEFKNLDTEYKKLLTENVCVFKA